ncbi:MAG: hypothetical protein KIS85_02235 [Anaerolineales bacterium]|nr:hypothetical protein [Anaerolineales bacterium]
MKRYLWLILAVLALSAIACSTSSITGMLEDAVEEALQEALPSESQPGAGDVEQPQPPFRVFSSEGAQDFELGAVLLEEDFSNSNAWEFFSSGSFHFEVADGAYRMQADESGYVWGLNETTHTDVVMEVSTNQLSAFENNAYGVMCRADTTNNGDGYYFMISGDGYYSIAIGLGDTVEPLVSWQESSAIRQGRASNEIRAVCIGSYLALYANGQFLADTQDSTFSRGYAGFAVAAFEDGDVDVTFDDLTIWAASFSE